MATITVRGFMHYSRRKYSGDERYTFFTFDASKNDPDYALIGPHSFEYEVPATFSPTAAALAGLQEQRIAAARLFAETVRRIDDEIGKLTAISYDGAQ